MPGRASPVSSPRPAPSPVRHLQSPELRQDVNPLSELGGSNARNDAGEGEQRVISALVGRLVSRVRTHVYLPSIAIYIDA